MEHITIITDAVPAILEARASVVLGDKTLSYTVKALACATPELSDV